MYYYILYAMHELSSLKEGVKSGVGLSAVSVLFWRHQFFSRTMKDHYYYCRRSLVNCLAASLHHNLVSPCLVLAGSGSC